MSTTELSLKHSREDRPLTRRRTTVSLGEAVAEDAISVASIDRPPSSEEGVPPAKIYKPLSHHVISVMIPFACLGLLARLGIQAAVTYEDQSIFPLAYVQAVGCLVMGFCLHMKDSLGQFYSPLYTALATGFCGSLTTFSGWQLDVFNSWVNASQAPRSGFRDFIDGVTKTAFTLALSLCSVTFGTYLASLVLPLFPTLPPPSRVMRYLLFVLGILTYVATVIAFFKASASDRHKATAALLFAFPGALTRYLLAITLNPLNPWFPIGTFTANLLGTGLLCAFHMLQNLSSPLSDANCSLLQGLADGFCGCLTTISTFAVEILTLKGRYSVRYVVISWGVSQALIAVLLVPTFHAGKVDKEITCTFE